MRLDVLALDGDGVSPEILDATLRVVEALELDIQIERADVGFRALAQSGDTIPEPLVARARAVDGVILGPVSHLDYPPAAEGGRNPSGVLRKELDLFANIRPARSYPGAPQPIAKPVELIIVRENTEGFYADRTMHLGPGEIMPTEDLALAIRKVTRAGSRRIAEIAFDIAERRGAKVTAVHKQNVLRVSDGLFLEETRAVAAAHPERGYDEALIDAAAAIIVRDPQRFEVIVTTNMFGDILSDLASELAGGLGLAGSLNQGAAHAMAQAQHGSAPDIAGQDKANPTSLILSAAMLLSWLGATRDAPALSEAAARLEAATAALLANDATRTTDLGGALGTRAFSDALIETLRS